MMSVLIRCNVISNKIQTQDQEVFI